MKIRKFQAGGAVPVQQGGNDPLMQIAELAMQALQNQDGEMALQVCQALLQLIEAAVGQQETQGSAPEESAPTGEPVYRRGGRLVKRV